MWRRSGLTSGKSKEEGQTRTHTNKKQKNKKNKNKKPRTKGWQRSHARGGGGAAPKGGCTATNCLEEGGGE
ncbi:unnamed protein product [Prunus armeniaca]